MTSSQQKRTVLAVLAFAILVVGAFCLYSPAKPPLRLEFICATNEPGTEVLYGVFHLENKTKDYMSLDSGCFQKRFDLQWADLPGTYDCRPGWDPRPEAKMLFPAGSTTIFRARVPGTEGVYRLVFECVPCVRLGTIRPAPRSLTYRIQDLLLQCHFLPPRLRQHLVSRQVKLLTDPRRLTSESFRARGSDRPH